MCNVICCFDILRKIVFIQLLLAINFNIIPEIYDYFSNLLCNTLVYLYLVENFTKNFNYFFTIYYL